jgi:CIC family chloride channel protein
MESKTQDKIQLDGSLPVAEQAKTSAAQAHSEIQEYLLVSQQRRRLFPRAALVGLAAGLVAIAFRAILLAGDNLRGAMLVWAHHAPLAGWLLPILFGAAGATLSVIMVRRVAPEAAGSGIPHLEAVLHRMRELNWRRVLPVKFFGGALALGAGLALGREGPTVQMGGSMGAAISDWLEVPTRDRLVLIAAGAGAGLAAAFNAPLAGVMFVLEEVQKDFRQAVFGAAFIAAATADIVARFASGQLPVFRVPSYPVQALTALPFFALLGLAAGLLGVVYNRTLIGTLNLTARFTGRLSLLPAVTVGAAVGLVAWFSPGAVGGGHALAETFLGGQTALAAIPLWFLVRFVLSMTSYGTGAPGGIFAPLLVLGALIGLAVGDLAHLISPRLAPIPASFAVVGMAAYFTAIVRAPLTGIVLILEMTGNYMQMLPLLVACFCAYAVAEGLNELPIYENLLQRDLLRGGVPPDPTEPLVLEMEVEPGAPFAGKLVRELGLPPGCILVSCREGAHEWVPTATTRLEPHVRLTAVVAPEAKGAINVLRHGCESAD